MPIRLHVDALPGPGERMTLPEGAARHAQVRRVQPGDALHLFDDAEYVEVPHGSHSHFVPRDRDPNVPLENFPSVPPRPNERIMPNGEVVRM